MILYVRRVLDLLILCVFFSISLPAGQDGFAPSQGVQIYYNTFGKGHSIVIINSGPGINSNGFEGVAKKLSANN